MFFTVFTVSLYHFGCRQQHKGCCFGHHCCQGTILNLIKHSFYFKLVNLVKTGNGNTRKKCTRLPTPSAAWIHLINTARGASGSTTMTMVMVCVMLFVLFRVVLSDLIIICHMC
jgi:hypothetical protein